VLDLRFALARRVRIPKLADSLEVAPQLSRPSLLEARFPQVDIFTAKRADNRDVDILNCRRSAAVTCALAALLNLHPVFGQVTKSKKAERPIVGLPAGAVLVEIQPLPWSAHADRMLALWMLNPQKHSRFEDEVYTCPERTRGNYYSGPTRVSLVKTASGEIINTVPVTIRSVNESGGKREEREEDSFDIPYLIKPDLYRVDAPGRGGEGQPTIINLKDYNADGQALEFALFDAQSCSDVAVQLIGYSVAKDKVIQFPFRSMQDRTDEKPWLWTDNLFAHKPVSRGHWHYTMTFPGATCVFDYRYRASSEDFLAESSCRQ
jgi:hypothetical protein